MSRSLLHDWEYDIERCCRENLPIEMKEIVEFIYAIAYARGKKNDVLYEVRAEIETLEEGISSYRNDRPWIFKDEVLDIIDKYKAESEDKE